MPDAKNKENKSERLKPTKTGDANFKAKQTEWKKSSSALRSFFSSPLFNVAALVLLLIAVFAGMRLFSARRAPAQLAFVERAEFEAVEAGSVENRNAPAPDIFKGEVYHTTVRLREAGALGMAISLAAFAEFSEKASVPANLDEIWSAVGERNLMPPEIRLKGGEIVSPSSVFIVRYQSQPLRFEICARPTQNDAAAASPALLLRFPLFSLDGRTITYFQTNSTNRFELPAPFAPLDKVIAAGWTLQQWRGDILPKNQDARQLLEEEKRLLSELPASR